MPEAASTPEPSWPIGRLTPRAIRAVLLPEEAGDFDREYRRVMAEATESLDLTPVLQALRRWDRVARLTERDPQRHRRMLRTAAALNAGEHVPMVPWSQVKGELGLQMYLLKLTNEVREQLEHLPRTELPAFAEALVAIEVAPWGGEPYNRENPEGNIRTIAFGEHSEGLLVYLIVEHAREVGVLELMWLG